MTSPEKKSRIVVVDCLRGFALFGLFIVHMVEYLELYWYQATYLSTDLAWKRVDSQLY